MQYDMKFEIPRSEKVMETAKNVSDYIKNLPLSNAQNDSLINLMMIHLLEAEHNAFMFGCDLGIKLGKDFSKEKKELS